MFRTDVPTSAGTLPTPAAPGTPGYFTNGNPALGIPATVVDQDWLNRIQEEMISVLNQAGVTPVKSSFVQLVSAIRACNILPDVSSSVNVLIANPSPPYPSLLSGTQAVLIPNLTNTSTSTLNVSSLGAFAVVRPDGTVVQPGDLPAGRRIPVIFDGTLWRLIYWPVRARLAQNLSMYCNAQTGNDNNNGLTAGTAFQTLSGIYNYIYQNFDLTGFTVTVQCTGNFSAGLSAINPIVGATIPGGLIFNFAAGSTIGASNSSAFFAQNPSVGFTVTGAVTVTATGTGSNQGCGIAVGNDAQVFFSGITFGTCATSHIQIGGFGIVAITGNYTISGNASNHWNVYSGGELTNLAAITITLSGTPVFGSSSNAFAVASQSGSAINLFNAITFSGSATGQRYAASMGGSISTTGAGSAGSTTFLPGSVTGSVGSGTATGFYN